MGKREGWASAQPRAAKCSLYGLRQPSTGEEERSRGQGILRPGTGIFETGYGDF